MGTWRGDTTLWSDYALGSSQGETAPAFIKYFLFSSGGLIPKI
jgi:hypothetical protein